MTYKLKSQRESTTIKIWHRVEPTPSRVLQCHEHHLKPAKFYKLKTIWNDTRMIILYPFSSNTYTDTLSTLSGLQGYVLRNSACATATQSGSSSINTIKQTGENLICWCKKKTTALIYITNWLTIFETDVHNSQVSLKNTNTLYIFSLAFSQLAQPDSTASAAAKVFVVLLQEKDVQTCHTKKCTKFTAQVQISLRLNSSKFL